MSDLVICILCSGFSFEYFVLFNSYRLILVASLLFHALKPKNSKHSKQLLPTVTAVPGLSFNPNSYNA